MRALVSGGGIGGLVTAIALRRQGMDVVVAERSADLRAEGAGLTLWINAMKALRRVGVADAVAAVGEPALDGDVTTAGGKTLTRTLARELVARYGEMVVAVHRADLQRGLLEAAGDGVVRAGVEVVDFEQDAEGVNVRFADGSEERAEVLIGADGLRSAVRRRLHPESVPRYAGYTAWRGVNSFTGDVAAIESWGRGERFGLVPLGHGNLYWFATANAPEHSQAPGGNRAELLRRFGRWHAPVPAVIEQTPESAILRNDIYDIKPLSTWSNGRVTLLGDAAHAMTPNLGQGACQAIEDAVVLADCLAHDRDAIEALRAYERARIPRTAMIIERSRRLGQVGQLQNPVATWLRDTLMAALPPRSQLRQIAPIVGYDAVVGM